MIDWFKIIDVVKNEDRSGTIIIEISNDFKEWFKKKYNLKRFSEKKFQKFVVDAIEKNLQNFSKQ